ncbi:MAG: precorrin-4 C(11)-methyltransferase [Corynebacterium sp.]|nr:precorrin-4 C(11)-methyltransferase [Corynebacterium sp.]
MTVYFIGAGPGSVDLLTVRAMRIIQSAPVCLYAGSIIPPEVVELCPKDAQVINTARMPLDQIMEHISTAHAQGLDVARLQSGDPAIYSAVGEQIRALEAGIDYEIIPGVPAFAAAAAAMGQELTVPELGQTVILTRISGRASAMPEGESLPDLARHGATLAIHLAAHDKQRITDELVPHYGADCPVVVVAYASRPEQQIIRTTLQDLPVEAASITRTAIIFVGPTVGQRPQAAPSFLYSTDRPRDEHGRTIPCGH